MPGQRGGDTRVQHHPVASCLCIHVLLGKEGASCHHYCIHEDHATNATVGREGDARNFKKFFYTQIKTAAIRRTMLIEAITAAVIAENFKICSSVR